MRYNFTRFALALSLCLGFVVSIQAQKPVKRFCLNNIPAHGAAGVLMEVWSWMNSSKSFLIMSLV